MAKFQTAPTQMTAIATSWGECSTLRDLLEVYDEQDVNAARIILGLKPADLREPNLKRRSYDPYTKKPLDAEKDEKIITEKKLSETARARVALLSQQIKALRTQISKIAQTLKVSEQIAEQQKVKIANLGSRLNAALASKVQELSRYRSEFFGRLRDVLGNQPGIRIVGDRFVFQSEVLFSKGSEQLGTAGRAQIKQLAGTLRAITAKIPKNIDWILRVDGHTDQVPIRTSRYPSNWELSTARAISVVKFLIEQGIPAANLAATGFGEYQPIDPRDTEKAYSRNRRIELKLTQR